MPITMIILFDVWTLGYFKEIPGFHKGRSQRSESTRERWGIYRQFLVHVWIWGKLTFFFNLHLKMVQCPKNCQWDDDDDDDDDDEVPVDLVHHP